MGKKLEVKKGDRYGMLTILEEVEPHIQPSGQKQRRVLVQCDCGSEPFEVQLCSLRRGHTQSCGCYENKRNKKYNAWDLHKDEGLCYGFTQKGERFVIDYEDYERVKDYCWREDSGYLRATNTDTGKNIFLHRLILNVIDSPNVVVDHISHDKTNNRKSNLRVCSASENAKNRAINSNNTSGVTGVRFHKNTNKWHTYIRVNNKQIYLGSFTSKEDAIKSRLRAEKEYYGEFSNQQHLYEQYGIE